MWCFSAQCRSGQLNPGAEVMQRRRYPDDDVSFLCDSHDLDSQVVGHLHVGRVIICSSREGRCARFRVNAIVPHGGPIVSSLAVAFVVCGDSKVKDRYESVVRTSH